MLTVLYKIMYNEWLVLLKVRDTDTILAPAVPAFNDLYRNSVACPGLGRPMLGCVYVYMEILFVYTY